MRKDKKKIAISEILQPDFLAPTIIPRLKVFKYFVFPMNSRIATFTGISDQGIDIKLNHSSRAHPFSNNAD